MEILKIINYLLALPLRFLILVYQKTISPDHGFVSVLYPHGYCQFYPSCSQYAAITLKERGVIGLPKIILRLISCR